MKFTLLTLNVWGAPYAQHRTSRMQAINKKIRQLKPDIICFQEAYLADNRRTLQHELVNEGWHFQYYFPSGLLGSGLLTVSRYPIIETAFHRFRLGGKPEDLQHGDYYAGKGIGLTRIHTPAGTIDIYNIHPHAQYQNTPANEYAVYTDSNLYDAARFIHAYSPSNPVILAGDYNTQPHESGYRLITTLTQLVDVYSYLNPDSPGLTFVPDNPYVQSQPQRLDYVMVKRGVNRGFDLLSADIVLTELFSLDNGAKAYSDHYGVLAELEIVDSPAAVINSPDVDSTRLLLTELAQRIQQELTNNAISQDNHTERALLGLASLLDAGFTLKLFIGWLPGWRRLRRLLLFAAILYAGYHSIHAGVLFPTRRHTLTALLDEIRLQLDQQRVFNGIRW